MIHLWQLEMALIISSHKTRSQVRLPLIIRKWKTKSISIIQHHITLRPKWKHTLPWRLSQILLGHQYNTTYIVCVRYHKTSTKIIQVHSIFNIWFPVHGYKNTILNEHIDGQQDETTHEFRISINSYNWKSHQKYGRTTLWNICSPNYSSLIDKQMHYKVLHWIIHIPWQVNSW